MTAQTSIDPFREMNRYDERDEDWPSSEVFEEPRRTLQNYWRKFHAVRDCGAGKVAYVEKTNSRPVDEKYEYSLRCWKCGHKVPEDEILFIGGEWFNNVGWLEYGDTTADLWLPEDRVLELGPDPDEDELVKALNLTRIERKASVFGLSFGNESYYECEDCGKESFLMFDNRCRMCYDGEWTERMQQTVDSAETSIRERNNSFVHRLEQEINPLSIKGRAFEDKILWRRHEAESVPQLVEVKQCLKDDSDGHWEYVLTDMTHTREWRYHEDDLADCFWDTGLYNRDEPKPVMDDRIREVFQRVCNHSFHTVHDSETTEPAGEQCINCRKKRDVQGN